MNNKRRRALIAVLTISVLIAVLVMVTGKAGNADGAETEYAVTDLDMRVAVSKDHTFQVEMFLSADLPQDLRRIEFALPGGSYQLKDLTVEGEKTRVIRRSSGNYVEIKTPELLTEDHHRYRITYQLLAQTDEDLFQFEILPAGWTKPLDRIHVLMWFPYGFPLEEIRLDAEESSYFKKSVKIEPQSRSYTIVVRKISPGYSLRLEAVLPDGYWE